MIGLCQNIVIVIYVHQITIDMYVRHIVTFIYVRHIVTLLILALLHRNVDYVLIITLRHNVLFVTLWHQLLYVRWHCKVMVNKLQRRVFVCQIMALEKFCHSPIEGICSSHCEIRKCSSHCNVHLCWSHDYVRLCTSHCENGFCSSHWDIWKDNVASGYVCQIACEDMISHCKNMAMFDTLRHTFKFITLWWNGYVIRLRRQGYLHHIVIDVYVCHIVMRRKCSSHCDDKEMSITFWC